MTDDLRAELDRLEALYGKGDPPSGWDNFRWEVAYAFPALAAELRRLWAERDTLLSSLAVEDKRADFLEEVADNRSAECDRLRAEVAALHAQLQRQAYVVPEGAQLVVPPHVGQVGYVLVRGGHVAVQEVTP